jgi:hypothetical protein
MSAIIRLRIRRGNKASNVESSRNLMAHGDAREGKWRGNWRMEWVANTLTLPRNTVYLALLPLMLTPRLPAVDWTDAPADLNGLVLFAERPNLVSARVPSHFKRSLQRNTKARSRNHFRSGKAKCVTFWVSDGSLSYPACTEHAPNCHLWPVWLYRVFSHYLIKGSIFRKESYS